MTCTSAGTCHRARMRSLTRKQELRLDSVVHPVLEKLVKPWHRALMDQLMSHSSCQRFVSANSVGN